MRVPPKSPHEAGRPASSSPSAPDSSGRGTAVVARRDVPSSATTTGLTPFRYVATDGKGKDRTGVAFAKDLPDARRQLQRMGLLPKEIHPDALLGKGPAPEKRRARARSDELVSFSRQLATLIGAGVALVDGLKILSGRSVRPRFAKLVRSLADELIAGRSFSEALALYPNTFPTLYVNMVKAGETSGELDLLLVRLAEYLENRRRLGREVRAALTYPVICFVLVVTLTLFLMTYIVPLFRPVLEGLGVTLPGLTVFVMDTAQWCRSNLIGILGFLLGTPTFLVLAHRTRRGGPLLDAALLRVPVFGPLVQKVALARFARTFATLQRAGVPILNAMDIVADTSGNHVIAAAVRRARERVRVGDEIASELARSSAMPDIVTKMVEIGEKSGSLETLLDKIASYYEEEVSTTTKSLTAMIEPFMIVFLGILVGSVVIATFLPLFQLQSRLAAGR